MPGEDLQALLQAQFAPSDATLDVRDAGVNPLLAGRH